MSKRLERFESIVVDSNKSGRWDVYQVTRFPMTGTIHRRVLTRNHSIRNAESFARGYAAESGIVYREMEGVGVKRIYKLKGNRGRSIYVETEGVERPSKIGPIVGGRQLRHEGYAILNTIVLMTPADLENAQEMEMDLHYGWLVPVGTAKISLRVP